MKVLIVCHGNINRSAAGEIILKTMLPVGWEVRSAGLKTKDGRITAKKMRDALTELGFSETSIRSTMMTSHHAEWADTIMYMDDGNERLLNASFLEHSSKFLHLGSLIGVNKIPDPNYAKTNELHKQVIDMLQRALMTFVLAHNWSCDSDVCDHGRNDDCKIRALGGGAR